TSAAIGSTTAWAISRTEARNTSWCGASSRSTTTNAKTSGLRRGAGPRRCGGAPRSSAAPARASKIEVAMEAGPRYLEGTTVGSGRDIIGVRRDRIADIIGTGREIITRAKSEKLLPDTITGATAALLVTIAG